MAKSDVMRKRIAELEAQLNGGKAPQQDIPAEPKPEPNPEPKKRRRKKPDGNIDYDSIYLAPPAPSPVEPGTLSFDSLRPSVADVAPMKATPVSEKAPEPQASQPISVPQASEPAPEPQASEPVAEPQAVEPTPEPQASEPAPELMTPDEMRAKADAMKEHLQAEMDKIEAQRKRCEDKIKALEEAAAEAERKEAEARAKAEEERKKAEELARAEAEAKAKAEAELQASINRSHRHVGKAYKWWDYDSATWNLVTDVWAANQLSDRWEVVYVWYESGEVVSFLNKEEMAKYCPRS